MVLRIFRIRACVRRRSVHQIVGSRIRYRRACDSHGLGVDFVKVVDNPKGVVLDSSGHNAREMNLLPPLFPWKRPRQRHG